MHEKQKNRKEEYIRCSSLRMCTKSSSLMHFGACNQARNQDFTKRGFGPKVKIFVSIRQLAMQLKRITGWGLGAEPQLPEAMGM